MRELIGNEKEVKFIFFRHGIDYTLPTPSNVKKFLGTKSAGFYKADGHYAGNIHQFSHVLDIVHSGLSLNSVIGHWRHGPCYMNTVLRLGGDAKRNVMFDLTHSEVIVDHLTLTKESLDQLWDICQETYNTVNSIKQAKSLIKLVQDLEKTVNKNKLIDPSLEDATELLKSDCFLNFANPTLKFLEEKIKGWYKSAKWLE